MPDRCLLSSRIRELLQLPSCLTSLASPVIGAFPVMFRSPCLYVGSLTLPETVGLLSVLGCTTRRSVGQYSAARNSLSRSGAMDSDVDGPAVHAVGRVWLQLEHDPWQQVFS
jgi:hypothetical protein